MYLWWTVRMREGRIPEHRTLDVPLGGHGEVLRFGLRHRHRSVDLAAAAERTPVSQAETRTQSER